MGSKKTLQERAAEQPAGTLDQSSILDASDVLGQDVLRAVAVVTEEWKPGSVAYVAELSAEERDEYETLWSDYKADAEDNVGFRAFSVAYCLCDAKRERFFTDAQAVTNAASVLRRRNAKATSRLFNVASRINGLTKADIDALEKNSEATPPATDAGSGESLSD